MTAIVINLPGVPVGKGRPRFSRKSGRVYTPEKTQSFEGALKLAASVAMAGRAPLTGPLAVFMLADFPVPASWSKKKQKAALAGQLMPTGKPDVDNLLKTLDALNEVVWKDDAQIVNATVMKRYDERPGVKITVAAGDVNANDRNDGPGSHLLD